MAEPPATKKRAPAKPRAKPAGKKRQPSTSGEESEAGPSKPTKPKSTKKAAVEEDEVEEIEAPENGVETGEETAKATKKGKGKAVAPASVKPTSKGSSKRKAIAIEEDDAEEDNDAVAKSKPVPKKRNAAKAKPNSKAATPKETVEDESQEVVAAPKKKRKINVFPNPNPNQSSNTFNLNFGQVRTIPFAAHATPAETLTRGMVWISRRYCRLSRTPTRYQREVEVFWRPCSRNDINRLLFFLLLGHPRTPSCHPSVVIFCKAMVLECNMNSTKIHSNFVVVCRRHDETPLDVAMSVIRAIKEAFGSVHHIIETMHPLQGSSSRKTLPQTEECMMELKHEEEKTRRSSSYRRSIPGIGRYIPAHGRHHCINCAVIAGA